MVGQSHPVTSVAPFDGVDHRKQVLSSGFKPQFCLGKQETINTDKMLCLSGSSATRVDQVAQLCLVFKGKSVGYGKFVLLITEITPAGICLLSFPLHPAPT